MKHEKKYTQAELWHGFWFGVIVGVASVALTAAFIVQMLGTLPKGL